MTVQNPFLQFRQWYLEAVDSGIPDPSIMTLATAGTHGRPSARILLLKDFDDRGFVFYTNYQSKKAGELDENPWAALVFHWQSLGHQIRIEGSVEKISAVDSDRYFASRSRGSQLGAWASKQSQVMSSGENLEEKIQELALKFRDKEVPRPPHWGGLRLNPVRIEFWEERDDRLHVRVVFEKKGDGWVSSRLAP
ncbi:pyridoxamine 5'-phosphate oxidase [Bacteroidota bacterium]